MVIIAQEQKLQYFGTVYNTIINDDRVNVRNYPSLNGNILFQTNKDIKIMIIGFSKEHHFIDNYNGYWVRIRIKENQPDQWKEGWVFSKYIDHLNNIVPSEIKILELSPKEERRAQRLIGSYQINGIEKTIILYPHKEEYQNFYTFAYNIDDAEFHYTNIPGSYAWYPETDELKHISYIGTSVESAWIVFTDDFKYIIEDFGTGPAPRGLGVWRINDELEIFSGLYYKDINLHGHIIEIIYVYDWWNIENKKLDNEILNYCENFRKNNPEPQEMVQYCHETGLGLDLIVICELNLDTGVRNIIRGQYIYTQ
jgi:hypothetical protein